MTTQKKEELFRLIEETVRFVRKAEGYSDDLIVESAARHICEKVSTLLEDHSIPLSDYSFILDGVREPAPGRNCAHRCLAGRRNGC